MGKFEKRFNEYVAQCFPHANIENRKHIKRLFYAGALEMLTMLGETSDSHEEQEVIDLTNEVNNWCMAEAEKMMKEAHEVKSRRTKN